jgi:hypothetical protein
MSSIEWTVAQILKQFSGVPNIEIEGKLGFILDQQTQQRTNFGYRQSTVLGPEFRSLMRFESAVPLRAFRQVCAYSSESCLFSWCR